MKYKDWLRARLLRENEEHEGEEHKSNSAGGFEPESKEDLQLFKNADLITLPVSVEGTNCGNCRFGKPENSKEIFCEHKEVHRCVTSRMCCKFWDNPGVKRAWGSEQS